MQSNSSIPASSSEPIPVAGNRRSFVAKMVAMVTGGVALLVPLVSGLVVFLNPLWRKAKSPKVRVALLSQVPADGVPRYFPVRADRNDAWNRYSQQRIGAVYLLRERGQLERGQLERGQPPIAFAAKCPHAGCFIGHTPGSEVFQCPCHTSAFHLDGTRVHGDAEVSPRDMDRLPVELKPVGSMLPQGVASTETPSLDKDHVDPTSEHPSKNNPVRVNSVGVGVEEDVEIWVEYIEFQTGHNQQIRSV